MISLQVRYPPGGYRYPRFEKEMGKKHQVSRSTIRPALQDCKTPQHCMIKVWRQRSRILFVDWFTDLAASAEDASEIRHRTLGQHVV